MELIALKAFTPDCSRHLKVGERFTISADAARILIATGRAKLAEASDKQPDEKRRYKRRDMQAQD